MALSANMAERLGERQLLWIDVDGRNQTDMGSVASAVGIGPALAKRLAMGSERAELTQYPEHIHLVLHAMEAPKKGENAAPGLLQHSIDVVAGRNWVVTVHDGTVRSFDRLDAETHGETRLGALDAAGFVAAIADEVLAGYLELVETIEREIDDLDERALRHRSDNDVLASIVGLRQRIGMIRRTLAPHRVAFAALGRPEMELHEELGRPWPGLTDRLEVTLEAVQNLRELLLGTFDIHMGRAAQEANDVMKVLTLLSAVLLPSVVLAGIMGMNFPLDWFQDTSHFWWVVAAMIGFALTMAFVARRRRWL